MQPLNCLLWIIIDADKQRWGRENRPHRFKTRTVDHLRKETINTVENPDGIDGSHRKTTTPTSLRQNAPRSGEGILFSRGSSVVGSCNGVLVTRPTCGYGVCREITKIYRKSWENHAFIFRLSLALHCEAVPNR